MHYPAWEPHYRSAYAHVDPIKEGLGEAAGLSNDSVKTAMEASGYAPMRAQEDIRAMNSALNETTGGADQVKLDRNNTNFALRLQEQLKRLQWDSKYSFLKYYQNLIREYVVNFDVGSRGILAYLEMGLGKSILAIAIAVDIIESSQGRIKPIILLTKSLQENMIGAIRKYIKLRSAAEPSWDVAQMSPAQVEDWIADKFSFVSMNASNMLKQVGRAVEGRAAREFDVAFEARIGEVLKLTSLDNKLLIVDEAHNLFRAITNGSKNAIGLYDLVLKAKNLRVVFLSGTPIANDPFEIVPCFNMLGAVLPESYIDFKTLFVGPDGVRNREKLQNRIMGLVSYLSHKSLPRPPGGDGSSAHAEFPEEYPVKVELVPMTPEQYVAYGLARDKEREEGQGYRGQRAEPPSLVKPKGKAASTYRVRSRQLSNYCPPPGQRDVKDASQLSHVSSPKFEHIWANIQARPGQLGIIYSQFTGVGGLGSLQRFLEEHGMVQYHLPQEERAGRRVRTPPAAQPSDAHAASLVPADEDAVDEIAQDNLVGEDIAASIDEDTAGENSADTAADAAQEIAEGSSESMAALMRGVDRLIEQINRANLESTRDSVDESANETLNAAELVAMGKEMAAIGARVGKTMSTFGVKMARAGEKYAEMGEMADKYGIPVGSSLTLRENVRNDPRFAEASKRMEELSREMEAISTGTAASGPTSYEGLGKRMAEIGREMGRVGKQMEAIESEIERELRASRASSASKTSAARSTSATRNAYGKSQGKTKSATKVATRGRDRLGGSMPEDVFRLIETEASKLPPDTWWLPHSHTGAAQPGDEDATQPIVQADEAAPDETDILDLISGAAEDDESEKPTKATKWPHTYAIISGSVSTTDRQRLQDIMNLDENKHGGLIDIILLSSTGAEGLDFKNIRHIHILEPYWNEGRNRQIRARGVRNGSHVSLPPEERNVQSYIYLAVPPESEWMTNPETGKAEPPVTTDTEIYHDAVQNHIIIESFNEMMQETSIECQLREGKCRVCNPTNKPLYTEDVRKDVRAPDPCGQVVEEEITATEVTIDGVKYYYVPDPESIYNVKVFEYDESVNSYRPISEADARLAKIADAINAVG